MIKRRYFIACKIKNTKSDEIVAEQCFTMTHTSWFPKVNQILNQYRWDIVTREGLNPEEHSVWTTAFNRV